MLLTLIIVLAIISLILIGIGFFLEDVNPYLILFGSMILLIIGLGIVAQGIEIKTGDILLNATPEGNTTQTSITQETDVISGIRINGIGVIVILLSLYLAFFSISEIISRKYGESDIE